MATPLTNSVPLTTYAPVDGLVEGGSWTFGNGPRVISYALTINDSEVSPGNPIGGTWQQSPWIASAVHQAFAEWAKVANVTFSFTGTGGIYFDSAADIAVTLTGNDLQTTFGTVASLGIFPDPGFGDVFRNEATALQFSYPHPEGDIFFDNYLTGYQSNGVVPGGIGFTYILHEIGHALGLKHPFDNGAVTSPRPSFSDLGIASLDSASNTIMGMGALSYSRIESGNPATPMLLDIQAIQRIYGANTTYHAGDDVYTLHDDGVVNTIWDAGGIDTFDFSAVDIVAGLQIDLRPGGLTTHGLSSRTAIAYGVVIENAIGSAWSDTIHGNDSDNRLDGGTGENASSALDTLIGHGGNDTYVVDSSNDSVVEAPGEGTDEVVSSATFTLSSNVENLTLTGSTSISATGNSEANRLIGNASSNRLDGLGGNDVLNGGAGFDILAGGPGDDTYFVDDFGPGAPSSGLLLYPEPGAYPYGGPPVVLTPATGTFDVLNANDTNSDGIVDSLTIRYLDSTMFFSTLMIGAPTGENLAPGSYTHAERFKSPGVAQLDFTYGGSGSNQSNGNFTIASLAIDYSGATPQIQSLSLSFENHAENMAKAVFGTFNWNAAAGAPLQETVIESVDDGIDSVFSSINFTLPANVELLTLTGTEHIAASGNALNNTLTGNAGHNVLTGAGGDDTLFGGSGYDTAAFSGTSSQYAFVDYLGSIRVADRIAGRDGVDITHDVEQARFLGNNVTSVFTASDVFTPLEYIASYNDLMTGFGANAALGYEHFISTGRFALRTASFDGLEYLASYPDLIAGLGMSSDAAATHYIQSGRSEGRTVSFNGLEYIASYTDLINSFGVNEDLGTNHYLSAGRTEGRTVTFRGLEYLASNLDLMNGFGANFELATIHYISAGRFEGRTASFHSLEYIASYTDLMNGMGANVNAGALHYITSGRFEGRAPSFHALEYIASYADLIVGIGANLDAGATHYILHGRHEGRTEHFDAAQYLANYADLAAGFGGNHELAAIHFIQHGYFEGRTDQPL